MNMMARILLAFVLVAGLSFAGISVSSYTVSKSAYQSGDVGVLTVTVNNPTGNSRVTGLTMTLYNPSEIVVSSAPRLADIESGGTAIVSVPFKVESDAKPGIYLFNVEFTGVSGSDKVTNTVSVPITVADLPIISINADTKALGGVDQITLNITNNGGPANNARLKLSNASGIALYGSNEYYIGTLSDSKILTLTLDSRSAENGPADLPFVLNYNDEIGNSHTDTIYLRLTVKKEELDLGFNQLSTLTTRQDGTLSLEITNNGDDISDVRMTFTNDSFRLKDSGELKVGDLKSGSTTKISGSVYPTLSPGLNLVSAKISWTEKDVRKEQTLSIPMTITSDSDIAVYLESKPSPLESGADHTISVLVSNIGSYGIDNVDVGINSTAFDLLDVTPRQYIGSLSRDDFSTVQFKVRMKSITGTYPIDIDVKYRDASGVWSNKTLTQSGSVTSPVATGNGGTTLIIVIVAVALIAIWYFKLRKRG